MHLPLFPCMPFLLNLSKSWIRITRAIIYHYHHTIFELLLSIPVCHNFEYHRADDTRRHVVSRSGCIGTMNPSEHDYSSVVVDLTIIDDDDTADDERQEDEQQESEKEQSEKEESEEDEEEADSFGGTSIDSVV